MITQFLRYDILKQIPHQRPFRFIDELLHVDENSASGLYTFREDEYFYEGHFPGNPITPGVILIETMAQIGMIPLGLYIMNDENLIVKVLFTSSQVDFKLPVYPGTRVLVEAKKIYFKLGKLKCSVTMKVHQTGRLICSGELAGMLIK